MSQTAYLPARAPKFRLAPSRTPGLLVPVPPARKKSAVRSSAVRSSAIPPARALEAVSASMVDTHDDLGAPLPLYQWLDTRGAGVLLHPTSLPGAQGIGTLDEQATVFLDILAAAGMTHWQVCPLGPTGYGDSPYQCFSAFAGNPYLIDLEALVRAGLLRTEELAPLRALSPDAVDFGALHRLKWPLLHAAHARFVHRHRRVELPYGDFEAFRQEHAAWLEPYAYFRALKDHFGGGAWTEWPEEVRRYESALASGLRRRLDPAVESHAFTQYLFFGQWAQVRAAARARGIRVIGDLPIFVAGDSADAWSAPHLFELDPGTLRPLAVAGVPPDYFSKDGQLWGNPLYRWDVHAADGFAWWKARLAASFAQCDIVRIDHFRGFDAYWRVPLPAQNARTGDWIPGPGLEFFRAMRHACPAAQIIAEDLGVMTDSVRALLRDTGLPGMAVLQFAFGGEADNAYLPHHHTRNAVIYPGTHDNDTTRGWYRTADERTRDHVRRYLRVSGDDIAWDFIRAAYASPARLAVVPLADLLALDSTARFNLPGRPDGNWQWRARAAQFATLAAHTAPHLRALAALYGR